VSPIRRTTGRRLIAAAVIGLAALALSACISLLPKTKPAQLYRFGFTPEAAAPAAPEGRTFGVLKPPSAFQREAAGDAILTVTGSEAAYIGEARWVAPAPVLFDEAVTAAFAADKGAAKLVSRGEPRRADYTLRLDVRSFEARYNHGPKAAPDVVVVIDAVLIPTDRTQPRTQTFEVTVTAGDNRVGAIVEAFNQALAQLLPQVAQWVDSAGPAKE
jgi:cholesterol transport system auxiliary component